MYKINADRTVFVDIDGTLIDYNLSKFSLADQLTVHFKNGPVHVVPNQKNINTLKKFYKLGYSVIVWSHTGADWAELIIKSLKLEDYVDLVVSKPHFYIDDLEANSFMGHRVWRDPITGEENG